jgi:hypothetical protein
MLGDQGVVPALVDRELERKALGILETDPVGKPVGLHTVARQALLPEIERGRRCDAPHDRVDHPGPRTTARDPGIFEERDVGTRAPLLVCIEEVVDGRVVLVDGLLHHPKTQGPDVELDVARGVGRDAGDVVDPLELHGRLPSFALISFK